MKDGDLIDCRGLVQAINFASVADESTNPALAKYTANYMRRRWFGNPRTIKELKNKVANENQHNETY